MLEEPVSEFDGMAMLGWCRKVFSWRDVLIRRMQRERMGIVLVTGEQGEFLSSTASCSIFFYYCHVVLAFLPSDLIPLSLS